MERLYLHVARPRATGTWIASLSTHTHDLLMDTYPAMLPSDLAFGMVNRRTTSHIPACFIIAVDVSEERPSNEMHRLHDSGHSLMQYAAKSSHAPHALAEGDYTGFAVVSFLATVVVLTSIRSDAA